MYMKKLIKVFAVSSTLISGYAAAAPVDQGHGKVTFHGSIINAPCSITPDSIDQTVEMGQISNKALQGGGKSTPRSFGIKLENCDVSALASKTVTATFTGMQSTSNADHLAITGTASGASIALTTEGGQDIKLGQPTSAIQLQNNEATLNFAAYLQGDAGTTEKPAVIVPGEFSSVANFTLAYQ